MNCLWLFRPVSPVVWAGRWWVGDGLSFMWLQPFRVAASSPTGPVSTSLSAHGGTGLFPQPFGIFPCWLRSHEWHREGRRDNITSSSMACPPKNDTTEDAMAVIPPARSTGATLWLPGTSSKTPLVLGEGREGRWVFPFSVLQPRAHWPLGRGITARKDVWPWPTSSVCVLALGRWGGTQVWGPGNLHGSSCLPPASPWGWQLGLWAVGCDPCF